MNPASIARLKNLLARELSSLLGYLAGAWPWAGTKERAVAERLQELIAAEQEAQLRLAGALRKARVAPPGARFPMDYTTAHYVAMDYLLPRLVVEQQRLIAAAEEDEAAVDADAAQLIGALLDLKRKHLAELERLAEDCAGTKAVSTLR
jgi:hypothetical protein